eukprot:CCRYP_014370-RA/>CCRYP_014370-RA protein AED:0.00 eAED:0.00 QI:0/0/0/1/0/0.5/2/0/1025
MADTDSSYRRYHSPTEQQQKQKKRTETTRSDNAPRTGTTALHTACSSPSSSLSKLRATLLALGPTSAAARDEEGRLPLHLLGRNELLIHLFLNQARYDVGEEGGGIAAAEPGMMGGSGASRAPVTELDAFVIELVRAFPRGMICTDASVGGRIPLTDAIYDWIEYSSRDVPLGRQEEEERGPSRLGMGSATRGAGEGSVLGSERLEGMSQLMGREEDEAIRNSNNQEQEQSIQRSVLTGLSLPSAFRSAYSASSEVGSARGTRATYRNLLEDPAARQQAEFKNVWSATAPRAEEDEEERVESGSARRSVRSARSGSGRVVHTGGQSDIVSNPPEDAAIDDVFPLNLAMPPVVEWSLRMISIILDGIESYNGPLGYDDAESFQAWKEGDKDGIVNTTSGDLAWIGNSIVSAVASIPSLMKTLLLLNDNDPVKSRVFNLSVVRRAISSKYTIGNWLVYMLEAVDPIVARRGVDYLEILSEDEDENALIPSTKRVRFAGTQLSPQSRAALYYKVSRLDYFLPAILALEDTAEVDRAAKTKLLRHILDKELGSRATLTMAFFDLFFLLMLLVSFQIMVYNVVDGGGYSLKFVVTSYLSMTGVIYAVLRKFGQMSSMIKISKQAFVENNFRWEDGVDWLAILLAIGGIVWMELQTTLAFVPLTDYMRSYLAAAICGLWCKLVSWLSVINWQVVNLVNIMKGMRWILLFLLMSIFASSQMFYVMLSGQNCQAGEENGYCQKKNAYLQVWSILLGQFDIADYSTTFSVIAFVGFTFFTFVILGYALIATSIDIYNKAVTFRSENSAYGNRSRLVYIAELRAFRRLFDQRWTLMQYCAALLFLTSTVVVFLFAAVEIRSSLGEYYSGGILGGVVALLLVFLFVSIMAFVSHMTYYSFVENSGVKGCGGLLCRCMASNFVVKFFSRPMERLMRSVVDIDGIHLDGTPSTAKYTDSWQGSATHIRCHVKRMLMQSEVQMASKLRNELLAMEARNKKANERSRTDVLTEIRASEERMERILGEFQGWMDRRLSRED